MNIFQRVDKQNRLTILNSFLEQIKQRYDAKEVYYLEFDEHSSFCVKHLGIEDNCSSYHKALSDKIERVAFEENIPVVIIDSLDDPRTLNTYLSKKSYFILVVPVRYKNIPIGTLSLISEKKMDIKQLHEIQDIADKLGAIINSNLYELDRDTFIKFLGVWFFDRLKNEDVTLNSLLKFFSNNGLSLNTSVVFSDNAFINALPCDVNNWEALTKICPAFRKNKVISSSSCKFSKTNGFICKYLSVSGLPFAIFSFSEVSDNIDNEWNELVKNILSKFLLSYYWINNYSSFFLYEKIFLFLKDLLKVPAFGFYDIVNKIADLLFEIWDNAAIYAYSKESPVSFEFVKINHKYYKFSDIINNYAKGFAPSVNFNGTFSFIVNYRNDSIVFDIVFINVIELNKNIYKDLNIVKSFFEIVFNTFGLLEAYRDEIKLKREEVKSLYSKIKKSELEIFEYQKKIIDLENRILQSKKVEEFLKLINSLSSIDDLDKKIDILIDFISSSINFRVNFGIGFLFNKIANKFEKIFLSNIPDYLEKYVIDKLVGVDENIAEQLIKDQTLFSQISVIHKDNNFFQLINKLYDFNLKSAINLPFRSSIDVIGNLILFFNNKIELSDEELRFLNFVSKELSRRIHFIKVKETLDKIKYIYALFHEFIEKLHFRENKSVKIKEIFEYLYIIISKLGFKYFLIYRQNKDFSFSGKLEFFLEFSNGADYFPDTISISKELFYQFNNILIFEGDKEYDKKFDFIKSFLIDSSQVIFLVPVSEYFISQFSNEYSNIFAVVISDNIGYSQFDIQVLKLIQKILSMTYNNIFLYYLNVRDKRLLFEVFEIIDDGIIVMDLEKRVLTINRSALNILEISQSQENILHKRPFIKDLLSDKSGEIIDKIINIEDIVKKYVYENINNIVSEATFEIDDKIKIIEYSFSIINFPIPNIDYSFYDNYCYFILLRDITKIKSMEKEKDDFIATISHDIKTPLTTMKGYLSTLIKYSDKITPQQRDYYLRVVNSEIDRINRMLNNLMDLRRLEGNILNINKIKFDLVKIIKKIVEIFKISYVNFEFEIVTNKDSIIVFADKDKIEQVLHNLLSNSTKYSPMGGKISINVELKEREVIVSISDQGMGIPPEDVDKIFEKYYRVKSSEKKIGGKGLGLYITKKIIELHSGKIWVESVLNKGTTFYFSLPT